VRSDVPMPNGLPWVRPSVRTFKDIPLPCPKCSRQPVAFLIDGPALVWLGIPLRHLQRSYSLKCQACGALSEIDVTTGEEIVEKLHLR